MVGPGVVQLNTQGAIRTQQETDRVPEPMFSISTLVTLVLIVSQISIYQPQPLDRGFIEQGPTIANVETSHIEPVEPLQVEVPAEQAPLPKKEPPAPPAPQISGNKHDWLMQSGIAESDWPAVDYIITRESGWNPLAKNSIGCLGLPQACPGSKITNACPDLNPVCQLQWATNYANGRYGGWWGAYNAWVSKHWW